jgi:hypothetical protein
VQRGDILACVILTGKVTNPRHCHYV